jgi:alkylation response protein AidB-like acyl-CoA dehydrogenase
MKLDLTEDQEMMRDTVRRFLEKEAPIAKIRANYNLAEGFTREYWRDFCGLGWPALAVPEALGGYSLSGGVAQDLAIIAEEMGRLIAAGPFVPTAVALDALSKAGEAFGDDIARLMSGEAVCAWAYAEAGDRWEPEALKTTARKADGGVVLNGAKAYVEAAGEADLFLVTARTDEGLVQVLAPRDTTGLTIVPSRGVDFVRRFGDVRFDDARLPLSAVVGEWGGADAQVQRQRQLAILMQCAESNGALDCAYEFTIDYMRQRYAFGRPIASYQALKHRLADMLARIHASMATTDAAIAAFDAGSPEAERLVHIAKTFVGVKASMCISDLVQMTGGIGVTWDHDLHIYERRIALDRAMYGVPERHRLHVHRLISA